MLLVSHPIKNYDSHYDEFQIIHLEDVKCDGSETKLAECIHRGIGVHNCSQVVGVVCTVDATTSSSSDNEAATVMGSLTLVFLVVVAIIVVICLVVVHKQRRRKRRLERLERLTSDIITV